MSLNDDVRRIVQAVSLKGADFLLVKDKYIFQRLSKMTLQTSKPMHLLLVSNFDTLMPLTENEMVKIGYVRKELADHWAVRVINWLRRKKYAAG